MTIKSCRYCGSSEIEHETTLILHDFTSTEGTQVMCYDCGAEYTLDAKNRLYIQARIPINRQLQIKETAKALTYGLHMIQEEQEAAA